MTASIVPAGSKTEAASPRVGLRIGAARILLGIAVAMASMLTMPAKAQTLDLGGAVAGPTLPDPCGADDLAKALQEEATTLSAEAAKLSAEARDALEARARLRSLAAYLMSNGARRPWAESAPLVAGMRVQGLLRRADVLIDATLSGRASRGERNLTADETRRAVTALQAMAAIGTDRVRAACATKPAQLPTQLTVALAETLHPLRELAEIVEGIRMESPWPVVLDARSDVPKAADRIASIDELRRRATTATVAGDAPAGAARLLDALQAARSAAMFEADLRMADASLDAMAWMDEQAAQKPAPVEAEAIGLARKRLDALLAALAAAVDSTDGPERRELAESLRILDAARAMLVLRSALDPANADRKVLSGVCATLLSHGAGGGTAALARAAERMQESCEAAARLLERRKEPPPKDLKEAARELEKRVPAALAGLPEVFATVAADPAKATDPAVLAALERVNSLALDRERIASLQQLVDAVAGIRMKPGGAFPTQAKRLAKMLASSLERSRAESTIAAIEMQRRRCMPLPYEEDLKRKTPRAIELSGGRTAQLVEAAGQARLAWAEALAQGDFSGEAVVRLDRIARLFECLQDLDRVESPITRDAGDRLATWGGWASRRAALSPAAQDLTARAKLACQSMAAACTPRAGAGTPEQHAQFERDVAALERAIPVVRLAAQLEARIAPLMPLPPDSVAALLAPLVIAPDPDAYLLSERMRLAMLDRALLESEFARRRGDVRYRDALGDFVASLARETLRSALGNQRAPAAAGPSVRPDESARPDATRTKGAR